MWSVSIGGCGLYQLVGMVHISWWVWSVSIGGCSLYQPVGVVQCLILRIFLGCPWAIRTWCEVVPLRLGYHGVGDCGCHGG